MAFEEVAEAGSGEDGASPATWPTVTLVFLVYNRREELRTSLRAMLVDSDYPRDRVDVIVVDNASEDGSSDMVREEFPDVRVIRREVNCGISGWNDGFAVAQGEWVLALDDDCHLPPDGLRRAMLAAREHQVDLVSFGVTTPFDTTYRFNHSYLTGLLSFWGCAVLMHRRVLEALRGFDPEIFVWAHELEFMLRFFDAGFRHLHEPDILALHLKDPGSGDWRGYIRTRAYKINIENFCYIAGKLLQTRDAAEAFIAVLATALRDAAREDRAAMNAVLPAIRGFARGLRKRSPVRRAVVSQTYRRNFHSFASPWWLSRPVSEIIAEAPGRLTARALRRPREHPPGRRDAYLEERARYYPNSTATLEM